MAARATTSAWRIRTPCRAGSSRWRSMAWRSEGRRASPSSMTGPATGCAWCSAELGDRGLRRQAHLAEERQEALTLAGAHDDVVTEEAEKSPGAMLAGVELRLFHALHPEGAAVEAEVGAAPPDRGRCRRGE